MQPHERVCNMEDAEIIRRIQGGDIQAFHELYDSYFEYAYRVAKAVMNYHHAYAKDAVQETFIRVYRNIHLFDRNKAFKPWFYKILLNECNRILKRNPSIVELDIESQLDMQANNELYLFVEYESLYKAIQNLDEPNRIVIILKYLSGFKEQEIAEVLGENVNTIKSRLLKGRKKLKQFLQCDEEGNFDGRL